MCVIFPFSYEWLLTHSLLTGIIIHHHIRHNNPGRVTASLRIRLQTSLSLATVHRFRIFNFFTSSWTASLHLKQGVPTPLLPSGLPSIILLTISSFFILWTWPAHLQSSNFDICYDITWLMELSLKCAFKEHVTGQRPILYTSRKCFFFFWLYSDISNCMFLFGLLFTFH